MTGKEKLSQTVRDLIGQTCERCENPYGSILSIDLGPLGLRDYNLPTDKMHGWRHLTILSPWRLQTATKILADWNVNGGFNGLIKKIIRRLEGDTVVAAIAHGPAWDLTLVWKSGLTLFVFNDVTDNRDSGWFILGTDGIEVSAVPDLADLDMVVDPNVTIV